MLLVKSLQLPKGGAIVPVVSRDMHFARTSREQATGLGQFGMTCGNISLKLMRNKPPVGEDFQNKRIHHCLLSYFLGIRRVCPLGLVREHTGCIVR